MLVVINAISMCLNFICLHEQQKYDYNHPPSKHIPLMCPQIVIITVSFSLWFYYIVKNTSVSTV